MAKKKTAAATTNGKPLIRDRIKELRRVRASDLLPSPKNWRTHPQSQQDALRGVLTEIGYADALLAREGPGGKLILVDGHLRRDTTPDQQVPVLVLDVTEAEADVMLATLDPLAALAGANAPALAKLMADIHTDNEPLAKMLADLAAANPLPLPEPGDGGDGDGDEADEQDAGDFEEDDLDLLFKSPYPWFGGKSRVAGMVWKRLGDVQSYIEPFFGSGAVFLNRPQPFHGNETINDFDGFVANFWRAVQAQPDEVAKWSDWPVNENDLTARHIWLVHRKETLQAKLEGDPDYFDAKIAGWWVWGMSLWIGGGFCAGNGPWKVQEMEDGSRKLVHLGDAGRGVNRQRVHLGNAGQGVNRKRVEEGGEGKAGCGERGLLEWIRALSERLRRVRVCSGDWIRVCGGQSGDALGHFFATGEPVGIFLDPPYADTADRTDNIYNVESLQVAHAVREWAIRHGDDPRLRIVLCGYDGEHQIPASWECVKWKAHGGMSSIGEGGEGKQNKFRERLWFSPHCLKRTAAEGLAAEKG